MQKKKAFFRNPNISQSREILTHCASEWMVLKQKTEIMIKGTRLTIKTKTIIFFENQTHRNLEKYLQGGGGQGPEIDGN